MKPHLHLRQCKDIMVKIMFPVAVARPGRVGGPPGPRRGAAANAAGSPPRTGPFKWSIQR